MGRDNGTIRIAEQRQRDAIEVLNGVAPRVVRVANAARTAELHLVIAEAIHCLEAGHVDLALRLLREEQADRMPTPGRRAHEVGTPLA